MKTENSSSMVSLRPMFPFVLRLPISPKSRSQYAFLDVFEAGPGKDPLEQLAALDRLLEEAKKLIRAQEQEVECLRAAGFDLRRAEALFDAYRASARITSERKQELERELARRSSS